jgi:ParB family chromosome partitioning protein
VPKASRDALKAKGKRDAYMFDPDDLVLVTDKKSPLYDERVHLPVDMALVANIGFAPDGVPLGVIKACVGRRNPETGKVEIVDGRQRVKATREVNKQRRKAGLEPIWVPVLLERGSKDHRLMGLLISANGYHHAETVEGLVDKAHRYLQLGRDEKEIAILLGKSESTVKNLIALLEAPAAIRSAAFAGKISASDGYKLSKLEPADAKKKLAELMEQAPRTPGKKRSKNAKKARAIMREGKETKSQENDGAGAGGAAPVPLPRPIAQFAKETARIEDSTAEAIAAWIDATWNEVDHNWDGPPSAIAERIRKGEWREHQAKAVGE